MTKRRIDKKTKRQKDKKTKGQKDQKDNKSEIRKDNGQKDSLMAGQFGTFAMCRLLRFALGELKLFYIVKGPSLPKVALAM